MEPADLRQAAERSMDSSGDVQSRVRELTLAAIRDRQFDLESVREVMKQITEGISTGAEARGEDMKHALAAACRGMDEAFSRSAQATRLALAEMVSAGRGLSDTELRAALDSMRHLEHDMLAALSGAAQSAGSKVRAEMEALAAHAARSGTDTGAVIRETAEEFAGNLARVTGEMTTASLEAARSMGDRIAQAASGFLAGLSDAMGGKPTRPDDPAAEDPSPTPRKG